VQAWRVNATCARAEDGGTPILEGRARREAPLLSGRVGAGSTAGVARTASSSDVACGTSERNRRDDTAQLVRCMRRVGCSGELDVPFTPMMGGDLCIQRGRLDKKRERESDGKE